jgi:hypothetical protein
MADLIDPKVYHAKRWGLPRHIYHGTDGLHYVGTEDRRLAVWGSAPDPGTGGSGAGIVSAAIVSGHLIITYSDGTVQDVGQVVGSDGSTGGTGSPGSDGTDGIDGTPGSVWRNGSGAPSNALGVDGDYYVNNVNDDVYFKSGGVYAVVTNIKGSTGLTGATGSAGTNGLNADMTRASTTSNSIALGSVSFTFTSSSTNLGWLIGTRLRAYNDATHYMEGVVTAVSATAVTVTADYIVGAGTFSSWTIGVAGDPGPAGSGGSGSAFPIATATGTVDAITADYTPDLTLTDKTICAFVALGANTTTTPTFAPDGLSGRVITKKGGKPLTAGDIPDAGFVAIVEYNAAGSRWELANPAVTFTTLYNGGQLAVVNSLRNLYQY